MQRITNEEQRSIALMNVSYYDSKAVYMENTFADVSEETGVADFSDQMERGFIQDVSCGTYNGATNEFVMWELTDDNILDTILNALHEEDFYNFVAEYEDDINDWTNADYIREYTEFYEVFIIGGSVYVNQD